MDVVAPILLLLIVLSLTVLIPDMAAPLQRLRLWLAVWRDEYITRRAHRIYRKGQQR